MKHFLFVFLVIFISLAAATCGPGKLFGPTFTPTPTITPTYTPIAPAKPIPVPIQTHTLPPTIPFTPGIGNGSTLERPADGMIMLYVPAGAFEMGSTRTMRLYAKRLCEQYSGDLAFGTCSLTAFANESPAHTVALKAFWIDRTEVTNAQYRQCVEAGACTPPEEHSSYTRVHYFDDTAFDEYPVIWVNWHMAAAYCEWAGARLPVEAEWEYAARGPDSLIFPWGNEFEPARLNYCDVNCDGISDPDFNDGFSDTSPVGSFPQGASWIGALDLAGNVREWVQDLYGFYKPGQTEDPHGPQTGESRIPRGGSWYDRPDDTRSANRGEEAPDYTRHNLGFRCVLGGGR